MGGDYTRVCHSVKNMIANLTGMICDGAKPSCALKISSGVSTALLSALLSMEGKHVTAAEGIIDEDVDRSIQNLTSIGKRSESTRLNSSHANISYAVFCLKKKKNKTSGIKT